MLEKNGFSQNPSVWCFLIILSEDGKVMMMIVMKMIITLMMVVKMTIMSFMVKIMMVQDLSMEAAHGKSMPLPGQGMTSFPRLRSRYHRHHHPYHHHHRHNHQHHPHPHPHHPLKKKVPAPPVVKSPALKASDSSA